MENLSKERIAQIAFETTGKGKNPYWNEVRMGRLTAENFGKGLRAADAGPHSNAAYSLKQEIYNTRPFGYIKATNWALDNEAKAIDQYTSETGRIVKPTGIWLFPSGYMGASPDGLVYLNEHDHQPVGILQVKCPYTVRDFNFASEKEWHDQFSFLDEHNNMKKTNDYYHEAQGTMFALNVLWCDFFIWTPRAHLCIRVPRDEYWQLCTISKLNNFYYYHLMRREDRDLDWIDEEDEGEDVPKGYYKAFVYTPDVNSILNPVEGAEHAVRYYALMTLHYHLARWIHHYLSDSISGLD